MTGNTFGKIFKITTSGESYSGAFRKNPEIPSQLYGGLVTIVDGVPAGIKITSEIIQAELDKRRPGQSEIDTKRAERDRVFIFSGVMENQMTTGAPVAMIIPNGDIEDDQIQKHGSFKNLMRPGQAAYAFFKKYGEYADCYGAGRASGRETASRVAGGAVAKAVLDKFGIDVIAYTTKVYDIEAPYIDYEKAKLNYRKNEINCPDLEIGKKMVDRILEAKDEGDTLGGIIEVIIKNVPAGLGEPVFDKISATLAHALMSIGAVKGFEIGKGFEFAAMKGSEANDTPYVGKNNNIEFKSNNAGGILGGITNGQEIRIRLSIKPTPTIVKEQWTVDVDKIEDKKVSFTTRNDPCICARIYPVCEAMARVAIVDALLINNGYKSLMDIDEKWDSL